MQCQTMAQAGDTEPLMAETQEMEDLRQRKTELKSKGLQSVGVGEAAVRPRRSMHGAVRTLRNACCARWPQPSRWQTSGERRLMRTAAMLL